MVNVEEADLFYHEGTPEVPFQPNHTMQTADAEIFFDREEGLQKKRMIFTAAMNFKAEGCKCCGKLCIVRHTCNYTRTAAVILRSWYKL